MRILLLHIYAVVFMASEIVESLGNTRIHHDAVGENVVDYVSDDLRYHMKNDHHCRSHNHHHNHDHQHPLEASQVRSTLLREELAEEEDLRLYAHRFKHDHELHYTGDLSGLVLWLQAMGCSLLVSMASLVCVFILPFIFVQGKPSNAFVDSLAVFGAGAMLGDAFLHQLPHAFGRGNLHAHDNHMEHVGNHYHYAEKHSHSFGDLSVGLSILSGIMVFVLAEQIVRYVEDMSGWGHTWSGHHHHHYRHNLGPNLGDSPIPDDHHFESLNELQDSFSGENKCDDGPALRNRKKHFNTGNDNGLLPGTPIISPIDEKSFIQKESDVQTNLVFGYLNLFSDGIHNFTDGMALGNAFVLYGSAGGWSRTLFLLAHELPQEVGDFGILVRSGFSVKKALLCNFMSALVALSGTAMVLLWRGEDPGWQSYLIEGFTAGGFVYISIAGVLAGETNNGGVGAEREKRGIGRIFFELFVLMLGMGVAFSISILE